MSKHNSNNSRPRKRIKNTRLLEKLSYQGDIQAPTSIELIQYDQKQFSVNKVAITDKLKDLISVNSTNWFKVVGISDVEAVYNICQSFGIHRFDVKDLLTSNRITKAITYENNTFILMSGCTTTSSSHEPQFNQVAFILGENYIISFQETTEPIFEDVKEAIKTSRVQLREKGADYLLYILLNDVHSSYYDTILKLSDKINEMEDCLIADNTGDTNIMKFIQLQKKEYTLLKRAITSMREEYVNVLHNTNRLIKNENMMYFNDYDDKLRTSLDDLEMYYLSISSLSDLYFNNNNLRMNNVIKKLTIVSTIFIPLTFMVGVWGMNFEYMPELKWAHGYLFAWGIMLLIIILAIFYLKHKKWF
ncbi:magnesium/cobalt transporter CorA [Dysgonomonas sp. OttesenSCG-928-M03]|nr:magnesium/cobalt transporter CorA [Dysgonomonas sp. OttesenSCG-928-M03]